MYDIIIIGAGPAGLTAAIYARRALKNVLVLEALNYGGQIINTQDIENYPSQKHISGFDFATNLYNQAIELGSEIRYEKVDKINITNNIKEVITSKNTYNSKTIIVATGSKFRKLGITLEDELVGRGISYCATCDGAFYKDKICAVVGGGNTALEDAVYLSNICKKVYLIHRRDEFRAAKKTIEQVKNTSNIEIIYNSNISKLCDKDKKIDEIEIEDNNKKTRNIKIDGLFIAIGRTPETDIVKNILSLDDNGYIIASENCHTNIEGIYVAGDIRVKQLRQLITAASDGAVAATEAINYIDNLDKNR